MLPMVGRQPPPSGGVGRWVVRGVVTVGILIFAFIGLRAVQFARYLKTHPRHLAAGEAEFSEAQRTIIAARGQIVAHGNTPEAEHLAARLSQAMKKARVELFTESRTDPLDKELTTGGDFLVFCQLNADACVFLIHVPDLRRFTSDGKESLAQLAYVAAARLLDAEKKTGVQKLVVATKGDLFYDRVIRSDYHAQSPDPLRGAHNDEVTPGVRAVEVPELYPFFAVPRERSGSPGGSP